MLRFHRDAEHETPQPTSRPHRGGFSGLAVDALNIPPIMFGYIKDPEENIRQEEEKTERHHRKRPKQADTLS